MGIAMIITAIFIGINAIAFFIIAIRQHMEKGMVFTNAWIYLSKAKRAKMNPIKKKLEYKLARNAFFFMGLMFTSLTVFIIFPLTFLWYIFLVSGVAACGVGIVQWALNLRVYKRLGIK